MMGAGRHDRATPRLKKKLLSVKIKWEQVAGHLQTGGWMPDHCKKCKPMEDGNEHRTHLTKKEKEKHKWAMERLDRMLLPEYRND